jgi:hypothetical protein
MSPWLTSILVKAARRMPMSGVMTTTDGTAVYRSRGLAIVLRVAGVWFALTTITLLLIGPRDAVSILQDVVGLLISLWALLWVSRCGIHTDGDGILIRNPFSTTRVPREQVRRFELTDRGPCRVERIDGSQVKAFGIQQPQWGAPGRPRGRRERAMIEELNRRLAARVAA